MKPGVHDISNDDYHQGDGFSRSQLLSFQRSPLHFWQKAFNKDNPEPIPPIIKQTHALFYGNALHTKILEPHLFDKEYLVIPKVNRATKKGKEVYEDFCKLAEGRLLLCEEAFWSIKQIADGVERNKQALELIRGADYEKAIYWNDPATDILCKVKPDIWHANMIVDLKTSADASHRPFASSVFKFGYHIQAAMIQEALKQALNIEINDFIFVAVEKEAPFAIGIYILDEAALMKGYSEFQEILSKLKICLDNDDWPGYAPKTIELPSWMSRDTYE